MAGSSLPIALPLRRKKICTQSTLSSRLLLSNPICQFPFSTLTHFRIRFRNALLWITGIGNNDVVASEVSSSSHGGSGAKSKEDQYLTRIGDDTDKDAPVHSGSTPPISFNAQLTTILVSISMVVLVIGFVVYILKVKSHKRDSGWWFWKAKHTASNWCSTWSNWNYAFGSLQCNALKMHWK